MKPHFNNQIHTVKQPWWKVGVWFVWWSSRATKTESLHKAGENFKFVYSAVDLNLEKLFYPDVSGDFLFLYQSTLALRAYPWRASTASVQHFLHLKRISNLDTTCMYAVNAFPKEMWSSSIIINKVELSKMVLSWNNKYGCTCSMSQCTQRENCWLNSQNKY